VSAVRFSRPASWAAAALLLGACASVPPPPDMPLPSGPYTTGRLAVRVDASAQRVAQSVSAGFELRGTDLIGELRLLSPLGTSVAQARWAPGRVRLETGEGQREFASLDELSVAALGEALPLAALPDWLAGRPWPAAPYTPNAEGFEQQGWQVQLTRQAEGFIEARRSAPPAVQLRIKLDPPA
jgi:outer membrane lipoprotein LolB